MTTRPRARLAVRVYTAVRIYPAMAIGITPGMLIMAGWAGEPGIPAALTLLRLLVAVAVVFVGGALITGILVALGTLASRLHRRWAQLEDEASAYLRTR